MIRPGDIFIALLGVAGILLLAFRAHDGGQAQTLEVLHANNSLQQYSLAHDRMLHVDGPLGETVIEVRDGRVRVVASPCTAKLCIRAGWLDSAGAATACVPNRVSIALLGRDPRFDAINF